MILHEIWSNYTKERNLMKVDAIQIFIRYCNINKAFIFLYGIISFYYAINVRKYFIPSSASMCLNVSHVNRMYDVTSSILSLFPD